MTFDPRARAREMAIDLTKRCVKIEEQIDKSLFLTVDTFAFERALLTFAREVLTQEPDDVQCVNGAALVQSWVNNHEYNDMALCERIYRAMCAHRAKSLEDDHDA